MQDLSKYAKRSHIEIHTKYVSLLLVGSVALIGLVFAVGVLVGSRRVEQPVCPTPDPLLALDLRSGEPNPEKSQQPLQLSFHDSLTDNRTRVPTPASLLLKRADDGKLTGQPSLENQRPVPLAYPVREEEPLLETVPYGEPGVYSLQVGSFQDQQEATEMIQKLARAGHEAFMVSVNMPERGGIWYRVRVGPFSSKQQAWAYKKEFEEKERLPAFVVKRKKS